jgi:hypothetical protein
VDGALHHRARAEPTCLEGVGRSCRIEYEQALGALILPFAELVSR